MYWETSESTVIFIGDLQNAANEINRNFLKSFQSKIFSHYLYIYLYYLDILLKWDRMWLKCNEIERDPECCETKEIQKLMQDARSLKFRSRELCRKPSYAHINRLFYNHLCNHSLQLPEKIHEVLEWCSNRTIKKKESVFISYRREGGVYLALLIYKFLKQVGREVFLDLKSLRSGSYEEQIYDKIDNSSHVIAVISKGSMERCQQKEDWVRKELVYAFQKKKTVIPILMEDIEDFDDLELPEELNQINRMQSIEMFPACFDELMEKLLSYLN